MSKFLRIFLPAAPAVAALALTATAGAQLLGEDDSLSRQSRIDSVFAVLDGPQTCQQSLLQDPDDPVPAPVHNKHTDTHYWTTAWHWVESTSHRPDTITHFTTSEFHNPETKIHQEDTQWIGDEDPEPIK